MSGLSLSLAIALGLLAIWHFRREQEWKTERSRLAHAAGFPRSSAPPAARELQARVETLSECKTELDRELYLRRLFETLLNEIRQGVVIVDADLRIRFANRTMAQLFHLKTIRREHFLLAEIQDHEVLDTVRRALQTSKRTMQQIRIAGNPIAARPRGKHLIIEAAPLPGASEHGAWLMVQDVTEQVMADQIRKDFVANASHELRTPLTLIQGYVETLQQGGLKDEGIAAHSLSVMEKHGRRIGRIVEDMLTISKLEDSGTPLNLESFNVQACVNDVVDHLRPMTADRSVEFDVDFPDNGSRIVGDRFYWDQIFTNLIENAIKENPDRDLTVRIVGQWFPDHCMLSVSDNGVGIAAHDVPFVFKRFYRGHRHHAQTIKGTGLGLSIVRRAVEAHQGSIDLESIPGEATTFRMKIPLLQPSENASIEPSGDVLTRPDPVGIDGSAVA